MHRKDTILLRKIKDAYIEPGRENEQQKKTKLVTKLFYFIF